MKKNILKQIVAFSMALMIVVPVLTMALAAHAQPVTGPLGTNGAWGNEEQNIQGAVGLGNRDPREIIASVVRVALGFLGIVAVMIILYGGFKWMTAGGNEDGIDEAKKMISAGVIGLVIILAAFGLAQFVINALVNATA